MVIYVRVTTCQIVKAQTFWPCLATRKIRVLFIILLNYIKPLSDVERFIAEHRAFLQLYYSSGHFLLSGRKEPRTGGVILAKADTRAEVESLVQLDPFYREQIAQYEIIEFVPAMAAGGLESLITS